MPPKLSTETVKNAIEERGFEMRGPYKNAQTPIDMYCPTCENEFSSRWANFSRGHGCKYCAAILHGNVTRHSFSKIKEDFESRGFTLLSEENDYKGNDSVLECICVCGRTSTKRYYDLMAGKKCDGCAKDKLSELFRTPHKEADRRAAKQGLTVLEYSYKTVADRFPLQCNTCNHKFKTSLSSLQFKNTGCPQCKSSNGERLLMQIVKGLDVKHKAEYKFPHDPDNGSPGCMNKKQLPFDMRIKVNMIDMCIEFDGIQHFQEVGMFGGAKSLASQRKRDYIKSMYCFNNRIPLLRIHYMDVDIMEDLVVGFINRYKNDHTFDSAMCYSSQKKYKKLIDAIDA